MTDRSETRKKIELSKRHAKEIATGETTVPFEAAQSIKTATVLQKEGNATELPKEVAIEFGKALNKDMGKHLDNQRN